VRVCRTDELLQRHSQAGKLSLFKPRNVVGPA
jgi:hypothetical protein